MKTSNKLLITLLTAGLLTIIGSTVALRAEHDKIDFNDPFYGFSSTSIKPFTVLKLEGTKPGLGAGRGQVTSPNDSTDSYTSVGVQAGKTFAIRTQKGNKVSFTYRSVGDTLVVRYEPEFYSGRIGADDAFEAAPFVYVIAPSFGTVLANGAVCKLAGLTTDKLTLVTSNARVLISNSTIGSLTATGQRRSLLQTTANSQISNADITAHSGTNFIAERDIFGSITLHADSSVTLKVPAVLLKKL